MGGVHCAVACPQDAIDPVAIKIDLGRCTFCGQCEMQSDGKFITFSQNFEMGTASREYLITEGSLPELAKHSKKHFKKLFGRSLQLRQVSAAGCNACEADTNVLNTPFYGSDEVVGDLNSIIPVDLYIPGCPPHPLTTLHALLNFYK